MKATRPKIMARLLVLLLVLAAGGASAQIIPVYDHLKCYQIRDFRTPGLFYADLIPEQMPPFAAELGCRIKTRAKFFCIDVQKNPVGTPTPPLHVVGQKAQDYLCYILSCPKPTPMPTPSLIVMDQFGQGPIVVKQPKYLCAPAFKVPSPTPPATPVPSPTPCPKRCVGGANAGALCTTATQCPGGTCTAPPCCCSPTGSTTACTTTADCPIAGDVCLCP
jgi:hypothetical protein